jgi:hypothetical protein
MDSARAFPPFAPPNFPRATAAGFFSFFAGGASLSVSPVHGQVLMIARNLLFGKFKLTHYRISEPLIISRLVQSEPNPD